MLNSCDAAATDVLPARFAPGDGHPGFLAATIAAGDRSESPAAGLLAAIAAGYRAEQRLADAAGAAGLPRLPGSVVATLVRLAGVDRALTVSEIQRAYYDGTNLSYGLNALVTAGLLWTTPHPTDRRRQLVTVSAAGRRAVAAILAELEG